MRGSKCKQSDITLHCSSPYHHQANSLAERAIATCKSLLRKALEEKECPYTALWIYRMTLLGDQMPSPQELLFGHKIQTTLPSSRSALKSKHPKDDLNHKANQRHQKRQAVIYDRKAGSDKSLPHNQEPVFFWNTLKNTWQSGQTYTVDIQGKIYQRTRKYLRPKSQNEIPSPTQLISTVTPVDNSKETCNSSDRATRPPSLAEASPKDSTPTPDQSLSFTLRCSEKQVDLELAGAVITSERTCSQPKSHVKRIGGITRLPTKFID